MKKCTNEGIGRKFYKRCLAFLLALAMIVTGLPMNNLTTVSAQEVSQAEEPSATDVTYVSITPNHQEVQYSDGRTVGYDITKLFTIEGVTLNELEYSTGYKVEIVANETTAEYTSAEYNPNTHRYSFAPTSSGIVVIRLVIFENQEAGISSAEATATCTIHPGDVNTTGYYLTFNDAKSLVYGTKDITARVHKMNGDTYVESTIKKLQDATPQEGTPQEGTPQEGYIQDTSKVEFKFAKKGEKDFTTEFPTEVGTYDVKAFVKTSGLWNEFTVDGEVVITAKPLSINVTTENDVYSYGDLELSNLMYDYVYDLAELEGQLGFNDKVEDLELSFSTTATRRSVPGNYKITATCTNPNYTVKVNYDNANHTKGYVNIQPKEITVAWNPNANYTYTYQVDNNQAVAHSVESNVIIDEILFNDDVSLQFKAATATLPGTYTAEILTKLSGEKAMCYEIVTAGDALKHNWTINYVTADGDTTPDAIVKGTTSPHIPLGATIQWFSGKVELAVPEGFEIPVEISLDVTTGWDEKAVELTKLLVEGKNEFTYYLRVQETGIIIAKKTVEIYYDNTAPSGQLTYKNVVFNTLLSEEAYTSKFFANKKSEVKYEGAEAETTTTSGLATIEYRIINRTNEQMPSLSDHPEGWNTLYLSKDALYSYNVDGYPGYREVDAAGTDEGSYNFIPNTYDLLSAAYASQPKEPYPEAFDTYEEYEQAYAKYQEDLPKWMKEYVPNAAVGQNVIEMRFTDWAGNQTIISSDDIFVFDELYPEYSIVDFTKKIDDNVSIVFEEDTWDYLYFPFEYGDKYISNIAIKYLEDGKEEPTFLKNLVQGTDYTYKGASLVIDDSVFAEYSTDTSYYVEIGLKPFGLNVVDQYSDTAAANDVPETTLVRVDIKKIQGELIVNHVKEGETYEKVYDGLAYGDFSYQKPQGMTVIESYALYEWDAKIDSKNDPVDTLDFSNMGMPKDAGKYIAKFELVANDEIAGCVVYKRFEIKPRTIPATMTVDSKTYDNNTDAVVTNVVATTGLNGIELKINPAAVKAAFNDENVGLSKEVKFVSIDAENKVLEGSDKYENYNVQYNVARADITPRPVTITLPDVSSIYGENPRDAIYVKQEDGTTKLVYETVDEDGKVIPVTGVIIESTDEENSERGLLEEHTYADLQISNYTTTATSKSNVIRDSESSTEYGSYPVSAKVANKNYNVSFEGKMIIEPKEAEFTWDYEPGETEYLFTTRNYRVKAKVANIINNNRFTLKYHTVGQRKNDDTDKPVTDVDDNKAYAVDDYKTSVTALGNTNYKLPEGKTESCSWAILPFDTKEKVTISEPDGTEYTGESDCALLNGVDTTIIKGWYQMTEDIVISAPDGYMICEHEIGTEDKDISACYDWDSEIIIDASDDGYHEIQYHLREVDTLYVTGIKSIYIAVDQTFPEGSFKIGEKEFKTEIGEFLYKLFFKDTTEITVNWEEGTSGVCKVEYAFLEPGNDVEADTVKWESTDVTQEQYTLTKTLTKTLTVGEEDIPATGLDKFVYVRFTDRAGNRTIINSSGLVLYTDSVYTEGTNEEEPGYVYTKFSKSDLEIPIISEDDSDAKGVQLYDNTVNGITITGEGTDTVTLKEGIDYEVTATDIVIYTGTLDKLQAKHTGEENYRTFAYSINISVNPKGYDISGIATDMDGYHVDEPSIVKIPLYIKKAATSISAHEYHKVYDGYVVVNPSYETNSDGEVSARYFTREITSDTEIVDGKEQTVTKVIDTPYKENGKETDDSGNWLIPKDAGEYWAEYSVAETDLYYGATAKDKVKIVVEKRPINVYVQVASKVYDGNKNATIPGGEDQTGDDGTAAGVFIDTGVTVNGVKEKFVYKEGLNAYFEDEKVGKNKKVDCGTEEEIAANIQFGDGTNANPDNYTMKFIVNPAAIVKRPVALIMESISVVYSESVSTGNIQYDSEIDDVSTTFFAEDWAEEIIAQKVGIVANKTDDLIVYYEGDQKDVQRNAESELVPYIIQAEDFSIESTIYDVTLVKNVGNVDEPVYVQAENINLFVLPKEVTPVWIATTTDKEGADVNTQLFYGGLLSEIPHVLPYNGKNYTVALTGVTPIVMGDEGKVGYRKIEDNCVYVEKEAVTLSDVANAVVTPGDGVSPVSYELYNTGAGDRTHNYEATDDRMSWSIYYLDEYYAAARDTYTTNDLVNYPSGITDKTQHDALDKKYKESIATNANGSDWKEEGSWYNSDIVVTAKVPQKEETEGTEGTEGTTPEVPEETGVRLISEQNINGYNPETDDWKESLTYTEEGIYVKEYALMDEAGYITSMLSKEIRIDKTKPTGKIILEDTDNNEHKWSFWETALGKLLFNIFVDDTVKVTIEAGDVINTTPDISGIKSVEYQLVEAKDASYDDTKWIDMAGKEAITAYNGATAYDGTLKAEDIAGRGSVETTKAYEFTIKADKKAVVYARITDNAGNITVINSDGVVVFSNTELNSEQEGFNFVSSFERFRLQKDNVAVDNYITTNNYPIATVTCNGMVLKEGTDYTVGATSNDKVKRFTLTEECISSLKANTYTINIKYKPMEEEYIEENGIVGDIPERTSFTVVVKRQPGEVKLDEAYKTQHTYTGKHVDYPTQITSKSAGERTFEFKKPGEEDSAFTTNIPVDAGTYVIRVTVAQDDNYEEAYCDMEFDIAKKEVIVEVPIYEREYDGTVVAEVIKSSYLKGDTGIEGEKLNIYSFPECKFTDANAGTDKEIVCVSDSWVELYPGTEKTKVENYRLTYVAAEGTTILPKEITVVPEPESRVYGDEDPELPYVISEETPLVEGTELGTVVLTTTATINSSIDEYYDIVLSKEESEINPNYKVVVLGDDLFEVKQRLVTAKWPTADVIYYNAKAQNYIPTLENVLEGDDVQVECVYRDAETGNLVNTPVEVGAYKTEIIRFTGTESRNYYIIANGGHIGEWQIAYADLGEVDIDVNKWYNVPPVLQAPGECEISTNGSNPDNGWVSSITFDQEADDAEGKPFTYYLKDPVTGYITDPTTIYLKLDQTVPTGKISIKENDFATIVNKIDFGLFFKYENNFKATVTANDNASGIAKIEYMMAESYERYLANREDANAWSDIAKDTWTEDEGAVIASISLQPTKTAIFARITDNAGNRIEINSDGVVVYEDVVVNTADLTYVKTTKEDISIPADLKGNSVNSVVIGKETLVLGEDYTVVENPTITGGKLILISGEYLDALAVKEDAYKVVITYTQHGVTFVKDESQGDAPEVSEINLYVKRARLKDSEFIIDMPAENEYSGKVVDYRIETPHTGKQTISYKPEGADDSAYSTEAPKNVGKYVMKVEVEQDNVYYAFEKEQAFSIIPKEVTVDVTPVSVVYGNVLPAFTGVVNKDTPMAEGENYGTLKMSLWAVEGEDNTPITGLKDIGVYDVIGESANLNYDVTVNGKDAYQIQPCPLIIDWPEGIYLYTAKEYKIEPTIRNLAPGDICNLTVEENIYTAVKEDGYTAKVTAIDNDNYTLDGATGITWNWIISYNEDKVDITVNDKQPSEGWYGDNITIQAPEGYLLSTQNTDPDNEWTADMTVTEEKAQNVTYYLKKISDGSITDARTWTAKIDRTNPTGIITIEGNAFKTFLNSITFGLFFKETADVVIEAADTASGVAKVEYQVTADSNYTEVGWKEYEEGFAIDESQKFVVYARITDGAGNRIVINTNGVVVYEDSVVSEEELRYEKTTKEEIVIPVDLKGNNVNSVVIGKDTLVLGEDYTVETDPEAADVKLIVISGDYLEKLAVKEEAYEVAISYAPQGVPFVDGVSQGEAPKVSKLKLFVDRTEMELENLQITIADKSVYNGEAVDYDIAKEPHTGKQTVYYKPAGAQDSEYTTTAPTNVGNYVLKVVIENDSIYKGCEATKEFSIIPREVTVNVTPVVATYGDAVPAFYGVVSEDTPMADGEHYATLKMSLWAVTENGEQITGKKEVGAYDVTGESANPNYKVTIANGTDAYQIQPRPLSIAWPEGIYLYTAKEQQIKPEIKNLVAGDRCNMTVIEDIKKEVKENGYTAVVTAIDNNNYTLNGATGITWNWIIYYNNDNVNITINDEQPSEAWYTEDIKIQAPEGYLLSTQNTDPDNGWTADMTVTEEKAQNVTYYLKKISDGSITDARTWTAKIDRTAPTGTITIKGNAFKTILNEITFGLFFKNTADVIIEGVDVTSGVAKVEYQISTDNTYTEDGWQAYEKFAVNINQKFVVYAKITDNAGFETIINSNGIVVYTDALAKTDNIAFTKTSTEDVTASVMLNGNTIKAVKNGTYTLTADDYSVDGEVITFKASYLNTLAAGNHVLEVVYNPLNMNYDETAVGNSEVPNTTSINLTVDKKVMPAGQGATFTEISDEMKYDGTAVVPQVETDSTGNMTIYYKEAGAADDTYTTEAPKNIGDYVVRVVIEPDENYEEIVVEKEFTIEPIVVEIAWSDSTCIYTGEQKEVTATITNAIAGDVFVLEYANNQQQEVGEYVAELVALGNSNYTLVGAQGTTCDWSISYSTDSEASKVTTNSSQQPSVDGWYADVVTITAPEGYSIKTDDMESWEKQIQITEDGENTVTIYVKNDETGEISKLDDILVKVDKKAPEGSVTVLDKNYSTTDETAADSYVVFRKENITGTIAGSDELDSNVKVEYQKVSDAKLYDPNGKWTDAKEFTVVPGETAVVYVKITDAAGNVTIVNSTGMVVYTDAQAKTTKITYTKESKKDTAAEVILNGNTVAKVTNGTSVLKPNVDYTVDANGKITFKDAYLNSLKEGNYTFVISYNPLGKAYVEAAGNQSPATTTLSLTVEPQSEKDYIDNVVKNPTVVEKNTLSLNEGLKVDQVGSVIKIKWGKVTDADGYQVYVQYCGKKFTKTPTAATKKTGKSAAKTAVTVKKVNGKKLDLKQNFKIYITAYKLVNKKKVIVGKTVTAHIVGRKNKEYTNVKAIKVKKSKYTLSVGQSATISAKTILVEKNKKQLTNHATEFRYASSNKKIAVVNAKGKITAKKKGTCTIFVYARNGYAKKITVKVK